MRLISLTLLLLFVFGMTVSSQTPETIVVKAGQQKKARTSRLTVKFMSVTEDSRCPVGTNCVWAGNARIKVRITGERGAKTFEFNTTMGPKGDIMEGWSIMLDTLTPLPRAGKPTNSRTYAATFNIVRLQR
ncbi:MAG: hypothetical protein ABIV21_09525 [Pyrinomonadaceae bacterium]